MTKPNAKIIAILFIFSIALLCVSGCHRDNAPKITQSQADGISLSYWAAFENTIQTNWTVTITARTNQTYETKR